MANRTALGTELGGSLNLTPGVLLGLRFLQIPASELREALEKELVANPALELEEAAPGATGAEGAGDGGTGEAAGPDGGDAAAEEAAAADAASADADAEASEEDACPGWPEGASDGEPPLPRGMRERAAEEDFGERAPGREPGLAAVLGTQLRLLRLPVPVLAAAEYLAACLDERGYLGCTLEQAARDGGFTEDEARAACEAIQGCEPAGVGARDLRECLLLQLRARGRAGTDAWRIVDAHWAALLRRRPGELARALRRTEAEVEAALEEIGRLRPRPGRLLADEEVRYIVPDLIVDRVDGDYAVSANERATPRLRLSRSCLELLRSEGDAEAREFARSRLRAARWTIRAVERRRSTMMRVMRCIVDEQREFFDHGAARLRPMTLRTVAGRLGMHESTVARVTRAKYAQTPRGLFPLRFFFSNRIRTASGEDASSRAVRERIRRAVSEEDRGRPLSDDAIAGVLASEGITIARRTVAKYRETLGIERAQFRRKVRAAASRPGRKGAF